jgi:hypothetical protein
MLTDALGDRGRQPGEVEQVHEGVAQLVGQHLQVHPNGLALLISCEGEETTSHHW